MCLFPQKVIKYNVYDKLTGEVKTQLKFGRQDSIQNIYNNMIYNEKEIIDVPCGRCIECLQDKSKEWSYRILCESLQYKQNCMITLTYKNTNGELCKRDLQLFLKRLRKKLYPRKIRFFACGEYGSKGLRPHYHIIIFNFCPNDLKPLYFENDYVVYNSKFISDVWSLGFISVMFLNPYNTKYVSKYLQKLNNYKEKKVKPFLVMSNRPGIGYNYFVKNLDSLLFDDRLYYNGNFIRLPRYVLKIAQRNLKDITELKDNRMLRYNLRKDYVNLDLKRYKLSKYFTKLIN